MQASHQLSSKKVAQNLALLVLLFGLWVGKANATVRYVTVGGTGAAPYTSWATAGDNWQTVVNSSASGDSVFVAAGTYLPASGQSFSMKQGVKIFGGFATIGNPTFTQRNWQTNITILQGNNSRVIFNNSNGLTAIAELDGFTITEGSIIANGGGMYNLSCSPTIRNCKFIANTSAGSSYGGGMYNNTSSPSIINCEFDNNVAGYGGGIYNENSSSPSIVGCSFTSNTVVYTGGGLRNVINSSPTIINCHFKGNTADWGGGIANANNCSPKLTNVLIAGNKANTGGGIYKSGGTDTLINCTVAGNYANATNGGGIYTTNAGSKTVLKNSIVYNNVNGDFRNDGAIITVSNSAYGTVSGGAITNFGNNLTTNPLFVNAVPATSTAATTAGNYQLQPCSPAINAGNNDSIPAGITTDLAGAARIFNTTIDMGAYEYNGSGIAIYVDSLNGNDANSGASWTQAYKTLSKALVIANTSTCGDSILVAKGTYYPTGTQAGTNRDSTFAITRVGIKIYGGYPSGGGTRDIANNATVLSGNIGATANDADNSFHVMVIAGLNTNTDSVVVDGFTITKGNASVLSSFLINGQQALSSYGGGVYAIGNVNNKKITIRNCSIVDNNAFEYGAGMYNYRSSPSIVGCNFTSNTATGFGGGLRNFDNSSPTIINCSFKGNTANLGGGIANAENCSPKLINVLITGNKANYGGGIHKQLGGTDTLINCTVAGNFANNTFGGGIYNTSAGTKTVIKNSIAYNNIGGDFRNDGAIITVSNSAYGTVSGGAITNFGNNLTINPLFVNAVPATSTAATTAGNYQLQPCSPAINAGNNDSIPAVITTDLAGAVRIFNTTIDMGAYEYHGTGIAIYVDSLNGNDANSGASWAQAYKTLSTALAIANASACGDSILVAKGTYYPTGAQTGTNRDSTFAITRVGIKIYGGYPSGGGTRDIATNATVLSGNIGAAANDADNSYHVMLIAGLNINTDSVVIDGFILTKGNANVFSSILINGQTINRSYGGGIYTIVNTNNKKIIIRNCSIIDNYAANSGGMHNENSSPNIINCEFKNNVSPNNGGGIYNFSSSPSIVGCSFTSNTAVNLGGGLYNYYNSSPTIINCNFKGNTANTGGGIANYDNCSPKLTNVLIAGNKASLGGGIYKALGGTDTLINCTVAGNYANANTGGGIYTTNAGSKTVLKNSIAYNNIGGDIRNNGAIITVSNSAYGTVLGGFTDFGNNLTTNPLFVNAVPATSTAATTAGNYQLQPCSPAINTGNNDSIPAGITTDLAGAARIFNTTVDMGAYEYQSIPVAITGTQTVTICQGQSFTFNNIAYTANNNTAKDTFTAVNGCDSIVTLNLTVNPYLTGTDVKSICQGQSYTFNNITYTTNNKTAKDTLVGAGGCDSIVTLNLTVSPAITNTVNTSICQGQAYSFGGSNYIATQSGIQHTFNAIGGCDSIVTLNLTVNPYLTGTDVKSICQGQSYTFNNITYTANNNTAKDTFQTMGGCDSIVTLNLTVNPYLTGIDVKSICQGQSYTFNNITYTTNNSTAKDTLVGAGGCDSIVTLNLTVSPAITNTVNASICQGQTYSFGGSNYNTAQSGIQHTFNAIGGCDSIVTLNLTVNPYLTGIDVKSICQGQSYTFNNITYTANNSTAKDTLVGVGGCDSIVTLNLTVSPAIANTVNASICQGQFYSFAGSNYNVTQSGIQHTFNAIGGCDSVVTLNLTVNPYLTGIDVKSICQGQSYTFNNITYSTNNNTAKDTLVGVGGCDSIVTLNLTVSPAITNTVNASICQGQSYSFAGSNYNVTQSGIQHTFNAIGGCDSIVTLNLTVSPAITNTVNASICQGQSYSFAGSNYNTTQSGIQHTFSTTSGCDSIVTLNLTVNPYLTGVDVKSICQGQSYTFNNITYTSNNGTAKDTFQTVNGCDSIVTLNLTVNPYLTGIDVKTICQGQSYTFNNLAYTANNSTAKDTFQTANGCDSIVTLNLTVVPALPNVLNVSICHGQTYSFAGNTYSATQSGIQHTFSTTGGCDSIVTLNLTVNPYLTGVDVKSICQGQSYTFNNITYTTNNSTAKDTFQTANGCDSIVTLNLTVNPYLTGTDVKSICQGQSYTFNNITHTANNSTAKDTFQTANGCDSIVTLNLTVVPALPNVLNVSICQGQTYSFAGNAYNTTQSGIQHTFSATGGCDSIVTLNLTVNPYLTGIDVKSICQGQSYTFNNITYTANNNTAKDTFQTANGCDSIVTLNLTVVPALPNVVIVSICQGQTYSFAGNTYSATQSGIQHIFSTIGGCDSLVIFNLTVNPYLTGADVKVICQGDSYTFNNVVYTVSNNTATDTFQTALGCDSIVTLNLTVNPTPTATVSPASQTICSGAATNMAITSNVVGATYSWTVAQSGVSGAVNGSGNNISQVLTNANAVPGTVTYTIMPTAAGCAGTATTATITVNPVPVLSTSSSAYTICSGTATNIPLSSTITGSTYSWSVTQSGVSGATAGTGNSIAQTLTNSGNTAGTATYTITPTANGCAGAAVTMVVTVNPKPTNIITPTIQTLCNGSVTNISLGSNVVGTTYSWTVAQTGVTGALAGNGNAIAQTLNTTAAVTGTATYTVTPTANGCAGTSSAVTVTVNTIPATPAVITGVDAPCVGSTQTYTTTTVTGATGYVWSLPPGWTGTSTTNSITVTVGSSNGSINIAANNTCGISQASSKAVVATPVLTPSINIASDAPNLHCSGTMVNFTASITNGGTNPVYQWMRNGSMVGANADSYSYIPQDGDTISCALVSNYPCLAGNNMLSNELIMQVTPTVHPELNIYVVENHLCSDSVVVLLATPTHGGSNPIYQWKLNNVNVGTNSVNYSYLPADGDLLSCQMTSNAICASQPTVLSNIVPMTIVTVTNPAITLNVSPGSNLTNGQAVTFTANISGQGPAAFGHQIRWYRNDVLMLGVTGNSWTAVAGTDVFNKTRIKAELQSFSPCAFPKTATSNEVQITIGTTGVSTKDLPDGFRAYPNPTANMVYFEGLEPGDNMIVRDIAGRVLLQQDAKSNKEQVNLSLFAQGAYIVYFSRKDGKLWNVKIVKD